MVLTSWKNIARYLNCGVRTAQRWERHSQLPVHRVSSSKRSQVIALSEDIDKWVHRSRKELPPTDAALQRHMQIIAGLENSISEQRKLLNLLRDERLLLRDRRERRKF